MKKNLQKEIGKLKNLCDLEIVECEKLESLPPEIGNLTKLKRLAIVDCDKLRTLPSTITKLQDLVEIRLTSLEINTFPPLLLAFPKLKSLAINFPLLTSLPEESCRQLQCEVLDLVGCPLQKLPRAVNNSVKELSIGSQHLESLPEEFGLRTHLQKLTICHANEVKALPITIRRLQNLLEFSIVECFSIHNLPEELGDLPQLRTLSVQQCDSLLHLPNTIGNLQELQVLHVSECSMLTSLPSTIVNLASLHRLHISECRILRSLPAELSRLQNLSELKLQSCRRIQELPTGMDLMPKMKAITIEDCSIEDLWSIALPPRLVSLQWSPSTREPFDDFPPKDDIPELHRTLTKFLRRNQYLCDFPYSECLGVDALLSLNMVRPMLAPEKAVPPNEFPYVLASINKRLNCRPPQCQATAIYEWFGRFYVTGPAKPQHEEFRKRKRNLEHPDVAV